MATVVLSAVTLSDHGAAGRVTLMQAADVTNYILAELFVAYENYCNIVSFETLHAI